ncbi:MAG: hypothetical protein IJ461_04615 [Clostridia bacterium]|nr:hypothetical protein [Clostridia bacterium]
MIREVKLDLQKAQKVFRNYFGIYLELRLGLIAAGILACIYFAITGSDDLYTALIITGIVAAVMLGDIRTLKDLIRVKKELKEGKAKQDQIQVKDLKLNTQASLYSIGGALEGKFKCLLTDGKGNDYRVCVGRVSDLTHILDLVKNRYIVIDYLPKSKVLTAIHVIPAYENEGEQTSFEFQLKSTLGHYMD